MPSSHKREFDFLVRDDYIGRSGLWTGFAVLALPAPNPVSGPNCHKQKKKDRERKKHIINYYN